jgi:chromosome condensin MukBEF complex kleisin-like MukF subunit
MPAGKETTKQITEILIQELGELLASRVINRIASEVTSGNSSYKQTIAGLQASLAAATLKGSNVPR